ncbi:hypothetical protein ABGF49_00425 [Helcococcus ovis]|uniref:Uncharacterized protein n=3 Tax=Helcococcus ovis TaxID=72026 RepID=A0A4R9C2M5_9FIRM|nr:hypothetical protein [Helcococcus ovis]TFF64454.1 hypothetical protein EQF92_05500 [Helcococcus ovis]TFF64698.1 hypothetical protein EQF91_07385 [Helcococcus ovis]TFF68100.1 hypothetical protein EQF93_03320 [Helcococcus ovis]WNZ01957.1 hypothetical protein EQF90_003740 [Helcococcus ovis]
MLENSLDFEKSLEYQFLYNEDPDSIYLLLSWLENKNVGNNFTPKYDVTKALLTGLRRSIRGRKDKKLIVDAISKMVSEDLSRLEFAFSIKAYTNAYYCEDLIDQLERIALKLYNPSELNNMRLLLQNSKDTAVIDFKKQIKDDFMKSKIIANNEVNVNYFLDKNIKKKFFRINFYIDKQVVVDTNNANILTLEGKNLTINELLHIYNKAKFYINRSINEAYFNQFWCALNDCVLGRYR